MDLSKLTPAPWLLHHDEHSGSTYIPETIDGFPMLLTELDTDTHTVALEFAALARNALDVMMRRGWGVYAASGPGYHPGGHEYGWQATDGDDNRIGDTLYSDPFTALVEADKWYRENAETKPE